MSGSRPLHFLYAIIISDFTRDNILTEGTNNYVKRSAHTINI